MPRIPKPARTLELIGAFKRNPQRARTDVKGKAGIGPYRPGASDPASVYSELVAVAPPDALTNADAPALRILAEQLALCNGDARGVSAAKLTAIMTLLNRFGFTPHGRAQLSMPVATPDDETNHNPWRKFTDA
jgi:hypothetical protein